MECEEEEEEAWAVRWVRGASSCAPAATSTAGSGTPVCSVTDVSWTDAMIVNDVDVPAPRTPT